MASALKALAGIPAAVKQNQDEATEAGYSVGAKTRMINDYVNATKSSPAPSAPKATGKPAKIDLVKSGAKFGDRPGEERIDTTDAVKPLGSFKKGTSKVKKTGVYKLHKNEAVATAKQAAKVRKAGGMNKVLAGMSDNDGDE